MAEEKKDGLIKKALGRLDGWSNIFTREGVKGAAKSTGFSFSADTLMTENEVRQMYRSDGFAAKIVDRTVGDMTREWFDVIGDSDGVINSFLRTLGTKKLTKAALTWAKVFGGNLMVMGVDDGGGFEDPLDEDNIKSIDFLKNYDRYRVSWTSSDLYKEPSEPKFGMPEFYTINPLEGGGSFRIHESRVLRFDAPVSDDMTFRQNNYWNESIFRKFRTELINVNSSLAASKDVMDDFIQIILKVENLQQMIAAGQDDLVKKRLEIIDLGRHIANTVMLDANEDYTKEASTVTGISKMLEQFQQALAAVSDMPTTILMGRSPGGQNATGDADIRLYYDKISDAQEDDLFDPMTRLIKLVMLSSEGPTKGKLEEWTIEFNPLWQPTEKEIVETRKTQSETDKAYWEIGALLDMEIRNSRFGGDEYSIETNIDETADLTPEPEDDNAAA